MANKTEQGLIEELQAGHKVLTDLGVPYGEQGRNLTLAERIAVALTPKGPMKLYTTHELGELLQVDPSSVVKWVNDGLLPSYLTPGGHRRIRANDALTFAKAKSMFIPVALQAAAGEIIRKAG